MAMTVGELIDRLEDLRRAHGDVETRTGGLRWRRRQRLLLTDLPAGYTLSRSPGGGASVTG